MNALQFDLLGDDLPVAVSPETTTVAPRKKVTQKVMINRRALWTTSGYLPGVTAADDDDEVFNVTSTNDTFSDNSTIERLEAALGLTPVLKNGRWATDSNGGFLYRVKGVPFKGVRQMGKKGTMLHQCNMILILESARAAIEALFKEPCGWLCLNAINVLSLRLRRLAEDEDPFACLTAFLQVMQQQDFIDGTRKGETIRNLAKRDRMREVRALRRKDKDQSAESSVPSTEEEDGALD